MASLQSQMESIRDRVELLQALSGEHPLFTAAAAARSERIRKLREGLNASWSTALDRLCDKLREDLSDALDEQTLIDERFGLEPALDTTPTGEEMKKVEQRREHVQGVEKAFGARFKEHERDFCCVRHDALYELEELVFRDERRKKTEEYLARKRGESSVGKAAAAVEDNTNDKTDQPAATATTCANSSAKDQPFG